MTLKQEEDCARRTGCLASIKQIRVVELTELIPLEIVIVGLRKGKKFSPDYNQDQFDGILISW